MPKIKQVGRARKPGKCQRCGEPIEVGQPYQRLERFRRNAQVRCADCPTWRRSEYTDGQMANVYAAQEQALERLDEVKLVLTEKTAEDGEFRADLEELVQEVIDAAEQAQSEYEDQISEYPFLEATLQERVDELESFVDETQSIDWPDLPDGRTEEEWNEWADDMRAAARGVLEAI